MTRPVIGLTTAFTRAKWSVWDKEAVVLSAEYVHRVDGAGATPVLLPPNTGDVGEVLSRLDAIIFVGGADINPALYGQEPHTQTQPAADILDSWDFALVKAAIKHKLPFLAICRGMQLVNIAQGGTLTQHLPDKVGHQRHRLQTGALSNTHPVKIAKGSVLEPIMGLNPAVVTYHHQAVDKLGANLEPIAWAEDGAIEALQLTAHPWGISVQWHPEADDSTLIRALAAAAKK